MTWPSIIRAAGVSVRVVLARLLCVGLGDVAVSIMMSVVVPFVLLCSVIT